MATAADLDQLDFIEPNGYVANGYPRTNKLCPQDIGNSLLTGTHPKVDDPR